MTLLELVRRQPFEPFRIYATDGRTYEVPHPDQIIALRSKAILGVPKKEEDAPDCAEHLALVLEELAPAKRNSKKKG